MAVRFGQFALVPRTDNSVGNYTQARRLSSALGGSILPLDEKVASNAAFGVGSAVHGIAIDRLGDFLLPLNNLFTNAGRAGGDEQALTQQKEVIEDQLIRNVGTILLKNPQDASNSATQLYDLKFKPPLNVDDLTPTLVNKPQLQDTLKDVTVKLTALFQALAVVSNAKLNNPDELAAVVKPQVQTLVDLIAQDVDNSSAPQPRPPLKGILDVVSAPGYDPTVTPNAVPAESKSKKPLNLTYLLAAISAPGFNPSAKPGGGQEPEKPESLLTALGANKP